METHRSFDMTCLNTLSFFGVENGKRQITTAMAVHRRKCCARMHTRGENIGRGGGDAHYNCSHAKCCFAFVVIESRTKKERGARLQLHHDHTQKSRGDLCFIANMYTIRMCVLLLLPNETIGKQMAVNRWKLLQTGEKKGQVWRAHKNTWFFQVSSFVFFCARPHFSLFWFRFLCVVE